MPSTYTSNNKIQKIATGEQSGTWGNTTNTNFDLFDTAIDGFVNITLSGTTHTLNIPDGSAGDGRNKVLVFTGTLAATNTVSVTPNTVKKHYYVQNNTTGGQNIVISQGSGSSVTIKPGYSSIVYLDGAGSGAAVKEVLTSLKLTALLEATGAVLNGSSSGSTTLQASATASGTLTLPAATDTLVGKATTDTFTNKTFDTAGTGNVLRINGTQVSAVTGTGSVVLATSPTLVTPLLGTPTSGTLTNCTGLPVSSGVSGLGTGVATALAVNVGSAGALVVNGGALGTPSSGTLTSCTGLPVSTGISGLGANVATFLATPSSANLAGAVTDETGSGALVFANTPTLVTPLLGTPTSGTLTNCTGLPVSTGVSGLGTGVATFLATPSSANLASAVTDETGTGALVFGTSPTIATPTITTSAVIPLVNGGTTASSTLTLQSTSGTGTSDAILFKTGSQQERMRITTSGAVGIGVTPSYTFEVRDAGSNSSIAISNSGATGELLSTITNATGVATISSLKQLTLDVSNAEPLIFSTTGSERMRISSSGNVSIGNTDNSYKLDVTGTAGTWEVIRIRNLNSGNSALIRAVGAGGGSVDFGSHSTADTFVVNTGGSERMRIDSSGNVGIGTSSPTAKVNVLSNRASVTYGQVWDFYNGGSFENSVVLGFNGSASVFGNFQSYPLTFHTGATERMRIDSSGNVGIGTSSLFSKFTVSTSGENFELNPGLASVWDGGVIEYINRTSPGTRPNFNILTNGAFKVYTGGSNERMRIDSSGNVSINTSTSGSKLQVVGTASLGPGSLNSFGSGYGVTATGANAKATASGNTLLALMTNDTLASNPLTLELDLFGNSTATSRYAIISCSEYGTGNYRSLAIQPYGGNVGIGTSSPAYQLQLSTDSAAKPTTNTWTIASDSRLKTVKGEYQKGLAEICQVRPVRYEYNGKAGFTADGKEQVSILAQELMQVFPECVDTFKGKLEQDGPEIDLYNYNGHAITFALINAIKELKAEIDILKARN